MVLITYYKILCNTTGKCYIGSTNNIKKRFNRHKSDYNLFSKNKINKTSTSSFEVLQNNNYEFIVLEEKEFSTLEELSNRFIIERKYIDENNNCINKYIPSQSIKEQKRKYYLKNRENIICKVKTYQKNKKLLSQ